MLRSRIPQFFHPEIRHLIQSALEEAWLELKDEQLADAKSVKERTRDDSCGSRGHR